MLQDICPIFLITVFLLILSFIFWHYFIQYTSMGDAFCMDVRKSVDMRSSFLASEINLSLESSVVEGEIHIFLVFPQEFSLLYRREISLEIFQFN